MKFSEQESERYLNQLALQEIGVSGQSRLREANILVVGAGGLGCPSLLYLTAAGIGKITIIDNDTVQLSNLQRQIIYRENDIGKFKAICAVEHLKQLNSGVSLTAHCVRLTSRNIRSIINSHDLVIDGTDNLATKYLINDACVLEGIPFIIGALHKFSGQVSVFNYPAGAAGTYRSVFPTPPEENLQNCVEAGILGAVAGIIGTIQATEAVKLISKTGKILSGKMLILNGLTMEFSTWNLPGNLNEPTGASKTWDELQNYDYEGFAGGINLQIGIDAIEFDRLYHSNLPVQFIDVRDSWEIEEASEERIYKIPLPDLPGNLSELNPLVTTVICCSNGNRSKIARQYLIDQGFTDVKSLEGGIKSWKNLQSQIVK